MAAYSRPQRLPDSRLFAMRLPAALLTTVDREAKRLGMTRSRFVREALAAWVKKTRRLTP